MRPGRVAARVTDGADGGVGGRTLLELADTLQHASPDRAAIQILAAFDPALDARAAAALDLGTRDAGLLDARTRWFGPVFAAVAACPACGAEHDVRLHADAMRFPPSTPTLKSTLTSAPRGTIVLEAERDGVRATFRLPTTDDLLAIEHEADPATRKRSLLARLLIAGDPCPATEAMVADACEAAAPQSDIRVAVACDACGTEWESLFSVQAFLQREIGARAERLLGEVHTLASAYGWSEDTILDLPPPRRGRYVAMAGAVARATARATAGA